jgi:hypothetical protein
MEKKRLTFDEIPQTLELLLEKLERLESRLTTEKTQSDIAPHPEGESYLTRQETAKFFKISLYTIHEWMKKGIIKPYKAGRRTYFKLSELCEVLNSSNLSGHEK